MQFPDIPQLNTDRLILRKLSLSDVQDYYDRIGSSAAVTKYMLFDPHQDISESVASVQKALSRYEAGRCYRWAIAFPQDNSLIGVIELLRFDEEAESCSFAYMIGENFWGKSYGTEALRAVLDFAFTHMDVQEVIADHFSANPASGACMQKAGMTHTQTLPQKYEKNGLLYDAEEYAITREQWHSLS